MADLPARIVVVALIHVLLVVALLRGCNPCEVAGAWPAAVAWGWRWAA